MRLAGLFVAAFVVSAPLHATDVGHEGDTAVAAGQIEGRPKPHEASPLQARIDVAADRATLVVERGDYQGDLIIGRPLHLVGRGRPRLLGSGAGSVVRIRA